MVLSYLIASGFMAVYDMGVDTIFICACKSLIIIIIIIAVDIVIVSIVA